MLLVAKVDEANTHQQAPIMTMGGYIARIGQWNRFDLKWRKALRKAGLDYFHAVEMPVHPIIPKCIEIADDNLMAGFVIRLDRKDYEEAYRDGKWGGKAQPDSMYGLCFRFFLSACLEIGLGEDRKNLKLNFVVESGHPNEGAPNEIVRRIKKMNVSGAAEHLGSVTPMLKKECYGLQAADGLATGGAWTEGPNGSTIPLSDISPVGTLAQVYPLSPLKAPLFRVHIDRQHLVRARDETIALFDLRREFGRKRHEEIQAQRAKAASSSERSS